MNDDGGKKAQSDKKNRRPSGLKKTEEESSTPSLGSLLEADSVARAFVSSRHPVVTAVPSASSSTSCPRETTKKIEDPYSTVEDGIDKQCPHCRKLFSNSWAVPKHILVSLIPCVLSKISCPLIV